MTDPSPDCGYTDVLSAGEETLKDAILDLADLAAGWCSPSARGNPEVINAVVVRAHDAASALAAAVAEQTQRADQAFEEIARLREFGEHYSGAAQDAWDRIAVLEAALRPLCIGSVKFLTDDIIDQADPSATALLDVTCGDIQRARAALEGAE